MTYQASDKLDSMTAHASNDHTMQNRSLALTIILALSLMPAAALADDGAAITVDIPALRMSGYGSLSWNRDNNDNLAPIRDISQKPKDSYQTGSGWRLDSRLAGQVDYRVNPQVELVSQMVLRDQVDHSATGMIELAYAQWLVSDGLKLSGGRVGYNTFLISNHRNLGYATTTARPPTEFYGWIPIFSVDGLEISQRFQSDAADWKVFGTYGKSRVKIPIGDEDYQLRTNYIWNIGLAREAGPLRINAGISEMQVKAESSQIAPLRTGLRSIAEGTAGAFPAISNEADRLYRELNLAGTRMRFATLGAAYDDGKWQIQGEISQSQSSATIAPSSRMAYLLVGHRIARYTPYAMLSASRPTHQPPAAVEDWSTIGQAGTQSTAYSVVNSTRLDQRTATLGTRWDFADNAALKLQWERTRINPQGYALWFRSLASNNQISWISLTTLSLDFIF